MPNINLQLYKNIFNEVYYPFLLDYKNRYEIYYGGAGSGKSYFVAQKLVMKALKSKRKVLVIRKVDATQKDSCWQLILDILTKFRLLQYCKINKSDFTIVLPNDSVFLFKGLNNSERIKSITNISDIWIEEATEITLDDFSQLDLRCRSNVDNLQLFLSFNPISKANWCYKYWFEDKKDNTFILKTTYKDNLKHLPKGYVDNLENMIKTNPTYYRIYALGEFCSLDKLVYTNWRKQDLSNVDFSQMTLLVGLDYGFTNDITALVISYLDEDNKKIYIHDEWCAKGKTNDEISNVIKSKGLAKSIIIADSAEPKSVEEMKRQGIIRIKESVKGADSILHGIQKLQQYELIVNTKCTETITELENYSWQKDKITNEYINKPIDEFNHTLDALRYSLQCVKSAKLRSMNKSFLGL